MDLSARRHQESGASFAGALGAGFSGFRGGCVSGAGTLSPSKLLLGFDVLEEGRADTITITVARST